MRQRVTIRLDPDVLKAARAKAAAEDQTLADYIEALIRQDLLMEAAEPSVKVVGPENLRSSIAVAVPGETQDERQRRDDVFFAILDASGHVRDGPV